MAEAYKPINRSGLQLRPFYAYKRWYVNNSNFREDDFQISILRALSPDANEKIPVSSSLNNDLAVDGIELRNSASATTPFLASSFQKSVWSSLNNTFFRTNIDRILYKTASVFSIPHNRLGDGVRPGSFIGTDKSPSVATSISTSFNDVRIDDYHGHIIDNSMDTGSWVGKGGLIGYWGFNEKFNNQFVIQEKRITDGSPYSQRAVGRHIRYVDGITTTGTNPFEQKKSGTAAHFNGDTSYLRIRKKRHFDLFKNDKYSISLWTDLPVSQSDTGSDFNWLVSKAGTYTDYGIGLDGDNVVQDTNEPFPIYPFEIKVANQNTTDSGKVFISISDGVNVTELTSSTVVNDGEHHIAFNKSVAGLELWVDGIMEASTSFNTSGNIWNNRDILVGSRFMTNADVGSVENYGALTGSIDELRIYKRHLTESQIGSLANNDFYTGSAYQTRVIGQIFYNQGIAVISDPRPKYNNTWLGNSGSWEYTNGEFTTEYKSTKLLYETSVLCEVGADEFNVSANPSLRYNGDINNPNLQSFVTGSAFNTYITTIGLYNDYGDLLAIGKLASPIKNRDDVDITIKVRFDLDGPFGTPKFQTEPKGKPITLIEDENGNYIWNRLDVPRITIE